MAGRQGNNLVPILQASESESSSRGVDSSSHSSTSEQAAVLPRRASIRVACQGCRRRRVRCDGQRPSCWQCQQRVEACVYEAEEGETVLLALRRRLAQLEAENNQYRELYSLLRESPEDEAGEILRRIKASDNPLDVLRFIKDAELLLTRSNQGSPLGSSGLDNQTSSSGRENHPSSSGQNDQQGSQNQESAP